MTSENLLALLNAELNRIKRIAGSKNIGLEFKLKDGSTIRLKQHVEDGVAKWFKAPEILYGEVLKIAEKDESKMSNSMNNVDGNTVVTTVQPLEINYIPVENILSFKYFFDVATDNVININTEEGEND